MAMKKNNCILNLVAFVHVDANRRKNSTVLLFLYHFKFNFLYNLHTGWVTTTGHIYEGNPNRDLKMYIQGFVEIFYLLKIVRTSVPSGCTLLF